MRTLFALAALLPSSAFAGTITLTLASGSLTNVNDAAGIWQIEGGEVFNSAGRQLGNYACTRRTVVIGTGGTAPQNTAMLTCTLFITGANPPENLTFQGAHDYSSGGFVGSISAASGSVAHMIGADVVGSTATDSVTFTW